VYANQQAHKNANKFPVPDRSPGRRRQDRFLDLYSQITGDVNIPTMLVKISNIVSKEMHSQSTTVYMVQPETQELHSVNSFGNILQMIKLPIQKDSLAGYCALTRESYIVSDAYGDLSYIDSDIRFDKSWDQKLNFRTKDVVCVPAVYADIVQGVIQVINSIDRPFDEDAIPPLKSLARMIGYAIYNARLYDELRTMKEVEKKKAEFMRIMIHELKSPVSAVKMLLSALPYLPKNDPRENGFNERIDRNMDKLLVLIEDVLNLSKIKSGVPMGEIKKIDIGKKLKAIMEDYREQIEAKGLTLRMRISDDVLNVRIDEMGLSLIVSNLVSNAIKYTEKGHVSVTPASVCQGSRILSNASVGTSISEAKRPPDRFSRLSCRCTQRRAEALTSISITGNTQGRQSDSEAFRHANNFQMSRFVSNVDRSDQLNPVYEIHHSDGVRVEH